jgi:hypothetical protein
MSRGEYKVYSAKARFVQEELSKEEKEDHYTEYT